MQKQAKMARHEAKARRAARARKDRVRSLAAEAATQEQVQARPPPLSVPFEKKCMRSSL